MKWIVISIIILIFFSEQVRGQSFDGVYAGEIISAKNALVISTTGNTVLGFVYLNHAIKYSFFGTYQNSSITATIFLPFDQQMTLDGVLKNDSLHFKIKGAVNPQAVKSGSLFKISSKPKYNLNKFFGNLKPEYNPLLFGEWQFLKRIKGSGEEVKEDNYSYVFFPHGSFVMRSSSAKYAELRKSLGLKSTDEPKSNWETTGPNLTLTYNPGAPFTQIFTFTFELKGDTLIMITTKGNIFFIKEKVRKPN